MAQLYIVSTPIGNRKDISLRALEVFDSLDYLLAEDTRKTGRLLDYYRQEGLLANRPQLISFYEANEGQRMDEVMRLLKNNKNVGLVSNSGTPLISDPGFKLVRSCIEQKIEVIAIPGASAVLTGLVISGLPTDKFMFLGFLPKKQGKKEKLIQAVKEILERLPQTAVFYESPFRVVKTLETIKKVIPGAEIIIGRELTKEFEEVIRGSAKELVDLLKDKKLKGEIVVMMGLKFL